MLSAQRASSLNVITDYELISRLCKFPPTTQSAILLTLIGDVEPKVITSLTWSNIKTKNLTYKSAHLLNKIPRHLFCELIFWRQEGDEPRPIVNFDNDLFEFLNGETLATQRSLYANMIYTLSSQQKFISDLNDHLFWELP